MFYGKNKGWKPRKGLEDVGGSITSELRFEGGTASFLENLFKSRTFPKCPRELDLAATDLDSQ